MDPADDGDFPPAFERTFAAGLQAAGWREFGLGHESLCFTLALGGSLVVTAYAYAAWPPPPFEGEEATFTAGEMHQWQASGAVWTVTVQVGVGWEPAMALMPLLWLRPDPALVTAQPSDGLGFPLERQVRGRRQAERFADEAVQLVVERAPVFAHRYSDVDAIASSLRDPDRPLDQTNRNINAVEEDLEARYLPILLAVTGRVGEARLVMDGYLAVSEDAEWWEQELPERSYQRFARKLNRWIDAGRPTPPALSAWTEHDLEWADPDWRHQIPEDSDDEGESWDEDRESLEDAEATGRRPQMIDVDDSEPESLGGGGGPTWMMPPVEATFVTPTTARPHCVPVQLGPEIDEVLARALTEASERGPRWATFDVWLAPSTTVPTRADGQSLSVYLGRQPIGRLTGADAELYRAAIADAQRFDEYPLIRAYLTRSQTPNGWQVEVERPLDLHPPRFL